jgi:hypothetical protein
VERTIKSAQDGGEYDYFHSQLLKCDEYSLIKQQKTR